ncbi:hypothetical protein B0H14DRAFT_3432919 [Mycena olivaceomarginata]|nr:hypothetical protein B0H14DRAFT_3432919 [Mycena olivaceomarginata]
MRLGSDALLGGSRSNEIIAHVLVFPPVALPDEPGTHPEPTWELISAFSVVSKTYRTLAIEAFRIFFSKSPADLFFLGEHSWTRELHCTLSHPVLSWDLAPFLHLYTIRFDCPPSIYRLPFIHTSICSLCNTCCRVRFAGIVPPTLVCTDGLGLPISYARALSTFPHLHTVRVALPYSPRGTHISLDPTAPPDLNAKLWAGERERCIGVMYEGLAFRTRYIARKQGVLLPNLTPSATGADRVYREPPALERVGLGRGWGDASEYAASDYGEEEEYVEREMGVKPEREQEGHPGGTEQQHLEHASGDEEAA